MPVGVQTLGQYFRRQCHFYEDLPALRFLRDGRVHEISFGRWFQLSRQLAAGMWRRGFRPGQRALIVARSSPEWALAFGAIQLAGGADGALEENVDVALSVAAIERIEARFLFSDRLDLLEGVAARRIKGLRLIWLRWSKAPEKSSVEDLHQLRGSGQAVAAFARFLALPGFLTRDSVASIIFKRQAAEGFGLPPAAMLSHRSVLQTIQGFASAAPIQQDDLILSGVPFSRNGGRLALFYALHTGAPLAISSATDFFSDSRLLKPSLAFASPDTLLRLVRRAREGDISERHTVMLIRRLALFVARLNRRAWNRIAGDSPPPANPKLELASVLSAIFGATILFPFNLISDLYLRSTLRPRLGGRLRAVFTGGQRLPPSLEDLFQSLDIALLDGYWLTEAGLIAACRTLEFTGQRRRLAPGTVGPTLPGIELRLIDARGEDVSVRPWKAGRIYLRGESLMSGYAGDNDRTAATLDSEGWLLTEDIGRVTAHGNLQLISRRHSGL